MDGDDREIEVAIEHTDDIESIFDSIIEDKESRNNTCKEMRSSVYSFTQDDLYKSFTI